MQPEDEAKLIHFYNAFQGGLREIPLEINAITQNLNIDISTFGYINFLKKELDKEYRYSQEDLDEIFLENFAIAYNKVAINSRVQMYPLILEITTCTAECVPIADSTYEKEGNETAWHNVFVGCFKYCMKLREE